MSFIKAKDLDKLNRWPNPYGLTIEDAKGEIKNYPLEIITLVLKTAKIERKDDNFNINNLCESGIGGAFTWSKTEEGHTFWEEIDMYNFNVFYKMYTPAKLRERLEEE